MKIISFNVNGLRAILSKNFINDFKLLDADIFSLNETKLTSSEEFIFPFNPEGYEVYYINSTVKKGYSGVAIFTKLKPINVFYGLKNNKYSDEGRVITLEFNDFYYVSAYVPNSGEGLKRLDYRLTFEADLIEYFKELSAKKPLIYGGDLNVAHNPIDLKNPKANELNAGYTKEERNAFTNLLNEGYIDTFRYLYPETIKYSWWSYRFNARKNNAGWRIDYFLVSESLKDKIKDAKIHNEIFGSDHCPIELEINL